MKITSLTSFAHLTSQHPYSELLASALLYAVLAVVLGFTLKKLFDYLLKTRLTVYPSVAQATTVLTPGFSRDLTAAALIVGFSVLLHPTLFLVSTHLAECLSDVSNFSVSYRYMFMAVSVIVAVVGSDELFSPFTGVYIQYDWTPLTNPDFVKLFMFENMDPGALYRLGWEALYVPGSDVPSDPTAESASDFFIWIHCMPWASMPWLLVSRPVALLGTEPIWASGVFDAAGSYLLSPMCSSLENYMSHGDLATALSYYFREQLLSDPYFTLDKLGHIRHIAPRSGSMLDLWRALAPWNLQDNFCATSLAYQLTKSLAPHALMNTYPGGWQLPELANRTLVNPEYLQHMSLFVQLDTVPRLWWEVPATGSSEAEINLWEGRRTLSGPTCKLLYENPADEEKLEHATRLVHRVAIRFWRPLYQAIHH